MQRIQLLLSRKQKTVSEFCASFLEFSLNLEHFQKKDDPHSLCISKITGSKRYVRSMHKKSRFNGPIVKATRQMPPNIVQIRRTPP